MGLFRFLDRRGMRTTGRTLYRYLFEKRGRHRVHGLRMFYRLRTDALLLRHTSLHTLVRRSEVRFWVDGSEAFRRIEKHIGRARHSIIIEMFMWKDDETGRRIAELLTHAADRGVRIDITKESVGDVFEFSEDFLSTKGQSHGVWKCFWSHNNIHIHHVTSDNHAKTFIFDSEVLLLTGMNIANEYRNDWHDYLVELRGSRFVEHYLTGSVTHAVDQSVRLITNKEGKMDLRKAVIKFLKSAERSILVEMAYISDPEIIDLLAEQSHKEIRVTVLFPEEPDIHKNANLLAIERLLSAGNHQYLRVLQYPQMLHGKLVLVDRRRALVGSLNFTTSSLDQMGEANVLIERTHRIALQRIRNVLRRDIARSRLVQNPPRLRWLGRWLAWIGL